MKDQTLDQYFNVVDHHIKRDIVKQLLIVPKARYAQLRPKNVESNLFMYHLQLLIKQNIVKKTDEGYELTTQGKQIADRISLNSLKLRIQPKIITILTVQKPNGEWLLIERSHQPFLGFTGFPSGKVHYGETLHTAAKRELLEKTGLTGIELSLRGTYIMRYIGSEQVDNHIIGYVFSGLAPADAKTNVKTDMFFSFWGKEPKLFEEKCFKGHKELIELLQNHTEKELFLQEDQFESDF